VRYPYDSPSTSGRRPAFKVELPGFPDFSSSFPLTWDLTPSKSTHSPLSRFILAPSLRSTSVSLSSGGSFDSPSLGPCLLFFPFCVGVEICPFACRFTDFLGNYFFLKQPKSRPLLDASIPSPSIRPGGEGPTLLH